MKPLFDPLDLAKQGRVVPPDFMSVDSFHDFLKENTEKRDELKLMVNRYQNNEISDHEMAEYLRLFWAEITLII